MARFLRSMTILIRTPRETVFRFMDDPSRGGMHMTGRSMMMMGSRLVVEQLSPNPTGTNARFRWHGRMMGIPMDFTTIVTSWVLDAEKTWETERGARMIILSWYRMRLALSDGTHGTNATLSLEWERPDAWP